MKVIVASLVAILLAVFLPSAADASFTYPKGDLPSMNGGALPRTVKAEADGLTVVREFDAKGQLRFLKDRKGATFEFRYDELGRRTP